MAITPLYFAFITKYVVHFVAQSLLFTMASNLKKCAIGPFSQVLSHIVNKYTLENGSHCMSEHALP